jgi:hypothetical protein
MQVEDIDVADDFEAELVALELLTCHRSELLVYPSHWMSREAQVMEKFGEAGGGQSESLI